jgi:hypothetical protein
MDEKCVDEKDTSKYVKKYFIDPCIIMIHELSYEICAKKFLKKAALQLSFRSGQA